MTSDSIFADLRRRYAESHRHYHDQRHVADLLALNACDHGHDHVLVEFAIWFHDAVYDPTRSDNEEQSARLAEQMLAAEPALALGPERIARVASMVRQTQKHIWTDGHLETALFLDFDLSILGASSARYDEYARSIRREYAHVLESDFRQARHAILGTLLARPTLYFTDFGKACWEAAAKVSVQRELEALSGAP